MADVVVFADAAGLVCDWLRPQLAARGWPVPVVRSVPKTRPPRFVTIQRHGGVRGTVVTDAAQLGVECWAEKAEDAQDLAQLARALLLSLPGQILAGRTVCRVQEWAGPADLPDPVSSQARYVFELQVHIRGLAV